MPGESAKRVQVVASRAWGWQGIEQGIAECYYTLIVLFYFKMYALILL